MMKHVYEVDYENHQIVVTKKFLKQAGKIGSEAYRDLAQARIDYPDYPIVQREIAKNPNKRAYGKLTYAEMEIHIKAKEDGDKVGEVIEEFEKVKQLSKSYRSKYLHS